MTAKTINIYNGHITVKLCTFGHILIVTFKKKVENRLGTSIMFIRIFHGIKTYFEND